MTKTTVTKRPEADNGVLPAPPPPPPQAINTWTAVRNLAEAVQVAELVVKSAALPDIRNAGQALLKILAGGEMGFGPFASLVGIHIIEGKPSVGAHLQAAMIRRSGRYDYRIITSTAQACDLEFFAKQGAEWESLGHCTLTMEEAAQSGLALDRGGKLKANWQRHPKDMLFASCVTQGYRQHTPDLASGVNAYDPDELDAQAEPVLALPAPAEDAPANPSPPPDTHGPEMAGEQQVSRIGELIAELGFTQPQWEKAYQARGVSCARELTREQASEMIAKLEAKKKG